jgi:hypothetical protein
MSEDKTMEEKLSDILHPSPKAKEFKVTLVFGYKTSPDYAKAVDLAKRNPAYAEEGSGEWLRHSATFSPAQVEDLFALFRLVHDWEKTEVLVNHKRIPYAHELWLPLMWFYRIR